MIEVKHDHKLQFPPIVVPKYREDEDDGPVVGKQTNVEGILSPLIRFNNTTITFEMVNYMVLSCNPVPKIEVRIHDVIGLIKTLDTPGIDNVLYLQILPPFDNAYKKIQLSFYITNTNIVNDIVTMYGTYYVPGFFDSTIKSYGIMSSYDLFDKISNDFSLGLCSNVDNTDDDRYIYNPNRLITDFMDSEIKFAGGQGHVYSWWIDFWNNINFIDLYKEYNEIVSDENMKIWVGNNFKITDDEFNEPYEQVAAFTNNPFLTTSPLYIDNYQPISSSPDITNCNFEVYSMDDMTPSSTIIQNSDAQYNIFTRYKYGGEVFGDFDYLTVRASRDIFLSKINEQKIEITSHYPLIALMKGSHVNIWWYDINNIVASISDNSELETNISTTDTEDINTGDSGNSIILNKTISGQYYIIDVTYIYIGNLNWNIKYTLSRSAADIQRLNPPTNETFMK